MGEDGMPGSDSERRPYTVLSCSTSIDGYIDDATEARLLLSTSTDFDRVDAVRATCDAIFVGAATVRRDNPRLCVRSASRQQDRASRGLDRFPIKVTVTASGRLDPGASFFTSGDGEKIVYCATPTVASVRQAVSTAATVIDAGQPVSMRWISADLHARGVRRLLVEGGGTIHTQFLTEGLVDELHLVIAPFFVGDSRAPRFVADGQFPWNADRRATLAQVCQMEDLVLLRYAMSSRFTRD